MVNGVTTNAENYAADFDLVAADPLPIGDIVSPTTPTGLAVRGVSGLRVNLAWRPGSFSLPPCNPSARFSISADRAKSFSAA